MINHRLRELVTIVARRHKQTANPPLLRITVGRHRHHISRINQHHQHLLTEALRVTERTHMQPHRTRRITVLINQTTQHPHHRPHTPLLAGAVTPTVLKLQRIGEVFGRGRYRRFS